MANSALLTVAPDIDGWTLATAPAPDGLIGIALAVTRGQEATSLVLQTSPAAARLFAESVLAATLSPARPAPPVSREAAIAQGFTGDCCKACGQPTMRRAGTCLVCASCGTTTGCS